MIEFCTNTGQDSSYSYYSDATIVMSSKGWSIGMLHREESGEPYIFINLEYDRVDLTAAEARAIADKLDELNRSAS